MARIENTTPGPKVLNDTLVGEDGKKLPGSTGKSYEIPRGTLGVNTGDSVKGNGVADVPDEVIERLRKNDAFTAGLFDSGALIITKSAPKAEAKVDDEGKGKDKGGHKSP